MPMVRCKNPNRKLAQQFDALVSEAAQLCQEGQWEKALTLYQRGLQMRPHSMICRAEAQRVSYIIKHALGENAAAQFTDLEKSLTEQSQVQKKKEEKVQTTGVGLRERRTPVGQIAVPEENIFASEKHPEFRELRKDLLFLKRTREEAYFPNNYSIDHKLNELQMVYEANKKYWASQNPRFVRRFEKDKPNARIIKEHSDVEIWKRNLVLLEACQDNKQTIKCALDSLTSLEMARLAPVDKQYFRGHLYYCLLKSYVDVGQLEHVDELTASIAESVQETGDKELMMRARYLEGRAKALSGNFKAASHLWEELLQVTNDPQLTAHLLHEVGRCHFKMDKLHMARTFGLQSVQAARESGSDVWLKNGSILVAQIETLLGCKDEALRHYTTAEAAARRQLDRQSLAYIAAETAKLGRGLRIRAPRTDDGLRTRDITRVAATAPTILRRPRDSSLFVQQACK